MIGTQEISNLNCFLLFLGRGRSGSSLCGALINSHPNAVVAHQKEFIDFHYENELELYNYFLETIDDRRYIWPPHRKSDWEWIKQYKVLKVIGTKRQGTLVRNPRDMGRFYKLKKTLSIPIKFINIYRNPFDNIATMYNQSQRPKPVKLGKNMKNIDRAISYYFGGIKMTDALAGEDVLNVKHENLVQNVREVVTEIFDFLELPLIEDHLVYCESIVWSNPRKTRDSVNWTEKEKNRVIKLKNQYDFLKDYTWEN